MIDNFAPIYKELFNEVVTSGKVVIQPYKPFETKPGFINLAVVVYNMLREMYDKNMQKYGKPLPSVNIKLNVSDTKAFLNKLRQYAAKFDGQFIQISTSMKRVLDLIKEKSKSQRMINGKPISEKPAEILPWSTIIERKVISSKNFERSVPTLIGRKFIKVDGKDTYENIFEIVKIKI
ncbi:MAG: hypothetical protein NZZ41_02550 [Candidatus Dojkabacteria bacterium]|nr:hypothetical protein [Candidatus Dojkabacteria bacterium]